MSTCPHYNRLLTDYTLTGVLVHTVHHFIFLFCFSFKETSTIQTILDHYIDLKGGDPLISHRYLIIVLMKVQSVSYSIRLKNYYDQRDHIEVLLKAERHQSVEQM